MFSISEWSAKAADLPALKTNQFIQNQKLTFSFFKDLFGINNIIK